MQLADSGLSGPRNAGPKWGKALINEALTTWSAEMLADPTRMGDLMNQDEHLEDRQAGGQEDEEDAGTRARPVTAMPCRVESIKRRAVPLLLVVAGAQAEVAELERLIDMYRQEESRHDQGE